MRVAKPRKRDGTVTEMPAPEDQSTPFDDSAAANSSDETPPKPPEPEDKPPSRTIPPPRTFDLAPENFFTYWIDSDALAPGRLACYVYRTLPVTDVLQPLSTDILQQIRQKKIDAPPKNILKLIRPPITDAGQWNRWICEMKGAGDYHFKLNDQSPGVRKTIAMCSTDGEGFLRDWDTYPPDLKPEEVVIDDKKNAAYLRWARVHKVEFPGDPVAASAAESAQEETDQMANAMETMARSNEALADKVIKIAERQQQTPPPPTADPAARAQMGGVETVVEASKAGMKIMGDAMSKVLESNVRNSDPAERLKETIELAKLIAPAPAAKDNSSSEMLAFLRMQMETQEKNAARALDQQEKSFTRLIESERLAHKETLEMLKGRLEALEHKPAPTGDFAPGTQGAAIDEFFRLRKKMREFEEEEGIGAAADTGPAWLDPLLQFGGKVIDGIGDTMRNMAAMRANQPVTTTVVDPGPQPLPAASSQVSKEAQERMNYAKFIHPYWVDAMRNGRPGFDFGAAIITQAGPEAYDALTKDGYNGVTAFLQAYRPLWDELMLPPLGTVALEKFIGELLEKEKVMMSIQMVKGQPQRKGPTVNQ